jgi:hypothetical protein
MNILPRRRRVVWKEARKIVESDVKPVTLDAANELASKGISLATEDT